MFSVPVSNETRGFKACTERENSSPFTALRRPWLQLTHEVGAGEAEVRLPRAVHLWGNGHEAVITLISNPFTA